MISPRASERTAYLVGVGVTRSYLSRRAPSRDRGRCAQMQSYLPHSRRGKKWHSSDGDGWRRLYQNESAPVI